MDQPTFPVSPDPDSAAALAAFERALHQTAPRTGFAATRQALAGERVRLATRRRLMIPWRWAGGIAAAILLGAGTTLFFVQRPPDSSTLVCPHGSSPPRPTFDAKALQRFLQHPERYPRLCHCQPAFSGNLR
jgi:hypothetical protein